VEARDFKDTVAQLSRSTLEAAHVSTDERCGITGRLAGGLGLVLEAVFKLSVLSIPLCALLLICALPIYVRFGSMGVADPAADVALRGVATAWAAAGALFAVGLTHAALLRAAGRRVDGAVLARRMLVVPLQPVLPLAYRLSETDTRDLVRNVALFAVGYGLLAEGIRWVSPDAAAQWSGLEFGTLAIGAAGLGAVYIAGGALSRVIGVPLKLARDIFNYIGDAGQRARIQARLADALTHIPDGADVIVVGHSLGSVIVLDSLCNSGAWARFEGVSLVTCGSPVSRFFQRFFPGLFFPGDPQACCARVQSRSRVVRWQNVYRAGLWHGDPVGQALFARGGAGTDVAVRQDRRVLMQAHMDYWNDPAVIAAAAGAWGRLLPPSPATPEGQAHPPVWHVALFDRAAAAASRVVVLCAVLGLVFGVFNAFMIVEQRRLEAREFLARAAAQGVETSARVTHSTTTWGYGEDLTFPVQVYEFEFRDRSGAVRRLTFRENEGSGFDGGLYFDSEALRQSLGREEYSNDRQTFDVRVLHLDDDPNHLTLANPRLRAVPSGFPVFEVLWTGIGASFWMMVLIELGIFLAASRVAAAVLPPSTESRPLAAAS
jgi:hypothetical protein